MQQESTSFKKYFIVCEGKSEYEYIQELLKILLENSENIYIKAIDAQGGDFTNLITKYKEQKEKYKKNDDFIIWADYDIYLRNNNKNNNKYIKSEYKNLLKFSYFNFEDFLIMHKKKDSVIDWQKIMEEENHFKEPIHSERVQYLIKEHEVFNDYKKGKIPIELNDKSFDNLRKNFLDKDIKFKGDNDFIEFLLEKIIPHR